MRIPVLDGGVTHQIDLVPSKIIGIGQNYRAHALEMKTPNLRASRIF
jgi:2-keto-4-pentenoate hydratase/2-oxohepta-3-ene-1,7-dioic acid hydratase in catechol pathway